MKKKLLQQTNCYPELSLIDRMPLARLNTVELKRIFKILANDTRLRMLHALIRAGELCVNDLADSVVMKPQAVSNQLQKMVGYGILGSRRNGNNIYYKIMDPCVPELLDRALCLIEINKQRKVSKVRPRKKS